MILFMIINKVFMIDIKINRDMTAINKIKYVFIFNMVSLNA